MKPLVGLMWVFWAWAAPAASRPATAASGRIVFIGTPLDAFGARLWHAGAASANGDGGPPRAAGPPPRAAAGPSRRTAPPRPCPAPARALPQVQRTGDAPPPARRRHRPP